MANVLICIFIAILALSLGAQTQSPVPAVPLPSQATTIDEVVVPIPSEIFATLDKFPDSNWRVIRRRELTRLKPHGDQAEIALLLGVVIAEGFVAVKAEDTAEVKSVGRTVLALARSLGVGQAALRRSSSIIEHAEQGDWPAVRKEWDRVLPDVERGMRDLKSERLAQLVSLGGWLRGTQVLSKLVLQNYSPENAALLRQRALLDHFEKQLMTMNSGMQKKTLLYEMRAGIEKIRALVAFSDEPIPKETVKEIAGLAEDLLKGLVFKDGTN